MPAMVVPTPKCYDGGMLPRAVVAQMGFVLYAVAIWHMQNSNAIYNKETDYVPCLEMCHDLGKFVESHGKQSREFGQGVRICYFHDLVKHLNEAFWFELQDRNAGIIATAMFRLRIQLQDMGWPVGLRKPTTLGRSIRMEYVNVPQTPTPTPP